MNIEQLISEIRYQHPLGVTTWSQCSVTHCDKPARGGRMCIECLLSDLSARVGPVEAATFVTATVAAHESACRMINKEAA